MRKKGIVLPETMKIIIGVLCLLILIYLAWRLYTLFLVKTELEQARETLKEISNKANGLKEGETDDYLIVAPKDWCITMSDGRLCACEEEYVKTEVSSLIGGTFEWVNREDCCKKGAIEKVSLKIEQLCAVSASVSVQKCVSFNELPMRIYLFKSATDVILTRGEKLGLLIRMLNDPEILLLLKTTINDDSEQNKNSLETKISDFLQKENEKGEWYLLVWKMTDGKAERILFDIGNMGAFPLADTSKSIWNIKIEEQEYRVDFNAKEQ